MKFIDSSFNANTSKSYRVHRENDSNRNKIITLQAKFSPYVIAAHRLKASAARQQLSCMRYSRDIADCFTLNRVARQLGTTQE